MNPSQILFRGSCAALITPFTADGKPDHSAMRRLIRHQIAGGARALLLCGTTGEGAALSAEERSELIAIAIEERSVSGKQLPIIVGSGTSCTVSSCAQSLAAAKAGADALLVLTPPYVKATEDGLACHLQAIEDAAALPILLYHVPGRTGMKLTLAHLETIAARCPGVVGIKEASGDLGTFSAIMEHFGDRFALYCGSDEMNFPALCLGASGLLSVLAVPCPALTAALCRLVPEGKIEQARRLHYASMPLVRALFSQVNPVVVKGLMARLGYCGNAIRLPLTGVKEDFMNEVEAIYAKLARAEPFFPPEP